MDENSLKAVAKTEKVGLAVIPLAIVAAGISLAGTAMAAATYWRMDRDLPETAFDGTWWYLNLLMRLPYLWLVSAALGLVAAYIVYRLIRLRLRYRALLMFVVAFVVAGATAELFHVLGMDATLKFKAPLTQPIVKKVTEEKCTEWNKPTAGQLGGRVTGADDTGLVVEDPTGKSWYVTTTTTTPGLEYANFLQNVRIEGEQGEPGYFIAKQIRPWSYQVPNKPPEPNSNNIAGPCKDVVIK